MKVSDRALNELKASIKGLLGPSAVKRIRKALGLTQKNAGLLISGGPNAFQKHESGEVLVGKAVMSALLLLEHAPPQRLKAFEIENCGTGSCLV